MSAPEIPKTHKACVYADPGTTTIKVQDVDTPEPGSGEVLIRLTHSGICHSDLSVMKKSFAPFGPTAPPGQVGGHEGVGEVVKLGPGCEGSSIKVGSRVGIKWVAYACLNCNSCLNGSEGLCFNQKISGYLTPGTFQQYVISYINYVTPIPDGVPSDVAAPVLCGGLTVYSAFKRSRVAPGEWIVISGAGGGLGHIACQLGSRGLGYRILGVDTKDKESLVRDCGAEAFVALDDYSRDEEGNKAIAATVKKATGGGASGVIVCTAANAAFAQALDFLKMFDGTLVVVGIPEGEQIPIPATPRSIMGRQLTVVGVAIGTRKEAIEILNMVSRGIVKPHISVHKMSELQDVFERMEQGKILGRCVLSLEE